MEHSRLTGTTTPGSQTILDGPVGELLSDILAYGATRFMEGWRSGAGHQKVGESQREASAAMDRIVTRLMAWERNTIG